MAKVAANIFDRLFDRAMIQENGCWEFSGARHNQGYGLISLNGKMYRAHRVAYDLCVGDIPEDIQVLHKCDNPPCVNPEHLFLGTGQDNMDDKVAKDRHTYGEGHGKLTEEQVIEIRALLDSGLSYKEVATQFNISKSATSHIWHGRTWAHLLQKELN